MYSYRIVYILHLVKTFSLEVLGKSVLYNLTCLVLYFDNIDLKRSLKISSDLHWCVGTLTSQRTV